MVSEISLGEIMLKRLFGYRLYIKLRLHGLENQPPYEMWFEVPWKSSIGYVIKNPKHYQTMPEHGGTTSVLPYDDKIIDRWWGHEANSLLEPPQGYKDYVATVAKPAAGSDHKK